jgi:hypothetical protein
MAINVKGLHGPGLDEAVNLEWQWISARVMAKSRHSSGDILLFLAKATAFAQMRIDFLELWTVIFWQLTLVEGEWPRREHASVVTHWVVPEIIVSSGVSSLHLAAVGGRGAAVQ